MEGSPKERPEANLPPSGQPPVLSVAPSDPQHLRNNSNISAEPTKERSSWFRKPDPKRRPTQAPADRDPPLPRPEHDAELGGKGLEGPKRNLICGCSKANFILIVFFMIVLVAAAVGGGVGGSLFAAKRDDILPASGEVDS